jgi:hypothetical protein
VTAPFEIVGGAGEAETAAIAAVVTRVLQEQAEVRAVPPVQPRPSPWVVAWRPREAAASLPSQPGYRPPTRGGTDEEGLASEES